MIARAEADGEEIVDDLADRLASSALLKVTRVLRSTHDMHEPLNCLI